MNGADPLKHRLALWLKSEKAMGLPSVPRVTFSEIPTENMSKSRQRDIVAPPSRSIPSVPAPKPASAVSANAALPLLDTPFDSPILPREEKIRLLHELDLNSVKGCIKCGLSKTRTQTVFGEGDPDAPICFIGEGPGKDEDASGRPFVGRAGQKLNDMIGAMGLKREDVFICNIVKCRAYLTDIGKDRPPSEEETLACTPYLVRQVEIIRPKVIVTLGLPSTRYLLKSKESMTRMRGNWYAWRGIKVMPTWHPAYVLRNYTEQTRREVWDDLKKVLLEIGRPIPQRSGKQE
jgi:uracil-DNA glycosylase family 4